MPDIMGIYRIPVAGTAEYRVYVQDFDGAEWSLTPQEYEARGYRPDALSLPLMTSSDLPG